jgi:electron transfer flavoprotein beta subunit
MSQTILVPVKAVPLGVAPAALTPAGTWAEPAHWQLDPINEVTLEWAVARREAGDVDRIVAVSVGPPAASAVALRAAHARGCDEQLTISTRRQLDVSGTARLLAVAAGQVQATIVACGYESYDGGTGAVPAATAAALRWSLATRLRDARLKGGQLTGDRSQASGTTTITVPLPAVVSFVEGVVVARNPSLMAEMAARRTAPARIDADTLIGDDLLIAWTTGLQQVAPVPTRVRQTQTLELDAGVRAITDLVYRMHGDTPAQAWTPPA